MCPRVALPASAPSSLRQIRYDSPRGLTSMSWKSSLVSGRYDQGRCSFRLDLPARRKAASSAESISRRETCSPRSSIPSLITETVPGRLQRDGRGDGGRRDDRRACRLRRAGGGRRRARAGPRSTGGKRGQRRRVGGGGRRQGSCPRPDRLRRARGPGRIGSDVAGALLRDELIARGVEPALAIDRTAQTGTMLVVHEPRERSMVADRGAGGRLSPDDLPERLEAGAVLVSGYSLLFEPTSAA